jgi:enoyl-CoA hydratase
VSENELKVTEHGRVLVLTMDRPQARNAMSMAMAHQIADALEMLDSRDDLSLGIITGANETFCAALAGGFEIVLSCDLVVASTAAKFGLPEVKRGLTAAAGGLLRLQHRIPYHLAMELVLTGRMWPATEAADVHLVNRLAEPGQALETALELATEVAANAPLALAASKRVLVESADWPLAEKFDRQEQYVNPIRESADAKEGAAAFVEKRDPVWTGR